MKAHTRRASLHPFPLAAVYLRSRVWLYWFHAEGNAGVFTYVAAKTSVLLSETPPQASRRPGKSSAALHRHQLQSEFFLETVKTCEVFANKSSPIETSLKQSDGVWSQYVSTTSLENVTHLSTAWMPRKKKKKGCPWIPGLISSLENHVTLTVDISQHKPSLMIYYFNYPVRITFFLTHIS